MRTINKPKNFDCDLSCGDSDSVHWFSVDKNLDDGIVVLSVNYMLGYAGLEYYTKDGGRFSDSNWCLINDVFFQNVEDMGLKKDFFDYEPINQAKILYSYIV